MQLFKRSDCHSAVAARAIVAAAFALTLLHAGAASAQNYYGTDQRYCDRSAINWYSVLIGRNWMPDEEFAPLR